MENNNEQIYQQLDDLSKIENTRKELEEEYNELAKNAEELDESLSDLNDSLCDVYDKIWYSRIDGLKNLKERLENAKHEKFIAKIISLIPNILIIIMSIGMCRDFSIQMIFRALGIGSVVGSLVSIYLYYNLTSGIRKLIKTNRIEDVNLRILEEENQYEKAKELYNNLSMGQDKMLNECENTAKKEEKIEEMLAELKTKKEEIINQLLITFQNNQSTSNNLNQEDSLSDKGPCKKMS
jgi:uncharacterized phage infection (PIP) family protein YhgE